MSTPVGIACVAVYGSDDVERAETLGIELQLINILRDVPEDWELGRVYLQQDELASFGVTEADIAAGRATAAWRATEQVSLRLNVNNVTDEEYSSSLNNNGGRYMPGAGRSFLLSADFSF